jgi:hypothetical protein
MCAPPHNAQRRSPIVSLFSGVLPRPRSSAHRLALSSTSYSYARPRVPDANRCALHQCRARARDGTNTTVVVRVRSFDSPNNPDLSNAASRTHVSLPHQTFTIPTHRVQGKIETMQQIILYMLNGENLTHLIMPVIKFCLHTENRELRRHLVSSSSFFSGASYVADHLVQQRARDAPRRVIILSTSSAFVVSTRSSQLFTS